MTICIKNFGSKRKTKHIVVKITVSKRGFSIWKEKKKQFNSRILGGDMGYFTLH